MKKKLGFLILIIAGMLMFPKDMLADDSYIYIDGVELLEDGDSVDGTIRGTATYDLDEQTLTLDNYVGSGIEIGNNGDFTIILKGENIIDVAVSEVGILSNSGEKITVTGDGTLTFASKDIDGLVTNGDLVIDSTTITCDDYKDMCMYSMYGNIDIINSTINITNTIQEPISEHLFRAGIYAIEVHIKNSNIKMDKIYGIGINADGLIDIDDSKVNIESTDACIFTFTGDLKLTNSIIDVNLLTDSEDYSFIPAAIIALVNTTIDGGVVHAKSGEGGVPFVGYASSDGSSFSVKEGTIHYPASYELNKRHVVIDFFSTIEVDVFIFGNSNEDLGEIPLFVKLDISDVAQEIYIGSEEDINNYINPKTEEEVPNTADTIDYFVASAVVSIAVLSGIVVSFRKRMN